jgi:hypothetical protein
MRLRGVPLLDRWMTRSIPELHRTYEYRLCLNTQTKSEPFISSLADIFFNGLASNPSLLIFLLSLPINDLVTYLTKPNVHLPYPILPLIVSYPSLTRLPSVFLLHSLFSIPLSIYRIFP